METNNKYDDETLNIDEVGNTDIKINPDYYIHTALLKAQNALMQENAKEGFLKFRIFAEHIETLCRAANMLSEDYEIQLNNFKKTKEYINTENTLLKSVKLANKKIEFMMQEVFKNKTITDPMKY